jgi:O-antigen/teichoic acid export membrane protein
VTNNQGNNILVNIFFGPVVNAARAIAFQVCNAIAVFSNNFFIVVTPPIVKNYSSGNRDFVKRFFFIGCKFSYFLLFMLFVPLILETPWILGVWLHDVGEYMVIFTRLALIYAIILSQHNPITAIIQATGKVKEYFVIVESFTLLTLPLTYLFFKLGYSPEYTFYITIIMFLIAHIMRLLILQKVTYISIKEYVFQFVISAIIVTVFSAVLPIFVHYYFAPGVVRFLLVTIISLISVGGFALLAGFNKQERSRLYELVIDKLKIARK